MTVEEYEARMRDLVGDDPESSHISADRLLCEIIRDRLPEFSSVQAQYELVGKWYA